MKVNIVNDIVSFVSSNGFCSQSFIFVEAKLTEYSRLIKETEVPIENLGNPIVTEEILPKPKRLGRSKKEKSIVSVSSNHL